MKKNRRTLWLLFIGGVIIGGACILSINAVMHKTSTNEACMSCHVHPHAETSWKQSVHHNSKSGVSVNCVECHLPTPGGFNHFKEKAKLGIKDLWAYMTKDSAEFNWQQMSQLEHAEKTVFNESCIRCHTNLFPSRLSDDGITSHLYYEENAEKLNLQCISCHLDAGHYDPNYSHKQMDENTSLVAITDTVKYDSAARITAFESFTETVPGTPLSFRMIAIDGGTFKMGSEENEKLRNEDEGPVREVTLSPFFMAEVEVTWDQYFTFYKETASEARTMPEVIYAHNSNPDIDVVSGPTPPFGIPDQGWGGGNRPAITMTHYGATTFCQWLSMKTGKKYRLPTEAEWEYAARGGTQTPYFFPGKATDYSDRGFIRKFFDADTAIINSYAVYIKNSDMKTQEPNFVQPNPFGLKNMVGNVMEYCQDWYAEDAYSRTEKSVTNPTGPEEGTEHVVRGGDFASDAADLRSAARGKTDHDAWLKTDPQQPKSIWWYSDIKSIGFRVVCEYDPENNQ